MDVEAKIFSSTITRENTSNNNLWDLISVVPAKPIIINGVDKKTCNFQPKSDKHYVPKKKMRTKVKTVRDIRILYENDVYVDLPNELDKQQKILLRKIRNGHSKDESTKSIAKNLLNSDQPISRSTWQILMNLNPEDHNHPIQYILWNGKNIQVSGSRGGNNKFIYKFNLQSKTPFASSVKPLSKNKETNKKNGLLKKSLDVKLKPGPLTKKINLDDSYQKYSVGDIEVIKLPEPGLDIQPKYGVALEPAMTNVLNSLRDADGTISVKWAEFAVSVLGRVKNTQIIPVHEQATVTFGLNYKYNRNRIIMRRDTDKIKIKQDRIPINRMQKKDECITSEVQKIMNDMLSSIEISLEQDNMYSEDEPRDLHEDPIVIANNKDKCKKKYGELDRLDVTIITLSESLEKKESKICHRSYCSLGCICASLECSYKIRTHCGRNDCMFQCKCDFSKYYLNNSLENDCREIIPGLMSFDNEVNSKLSKEEQKFHQTVIMTGEKSILLQSKRRNWKTSRKYADFYSKMCLKSDTKSKKVLSVVDVKLKFDNIEPWCMVHNLYKCFCKGKFTEKCIPDKILEGSNVLVQNDTIEIPDEDMPKETQPFRRSLRSEYKETYRKSLESDYKSEDLESENKNSTSRRTRPYTRRKYTKSYYHDMNRKIQEMEKNDINLNKKLLSIINRTNDDEKTNYKNDDKKANMKNNDEKVNPCNSNIGYHDFKETEVLIDTTPAIEQVASDESTSSVQISKRMPNKENLISWLETSYKQYKRNIGQGIVKKFLDPPKLGKVALYPWEFILSRYRERKNLFLISKLKPFRIFMAVDTKNSIFENCINIDDIRFADLHKYPITINNLLTNATDLKDNFCILYGLSHCWELIGSVTKVNELNKNQDSQDNLPNTDSYLSLDSLPAYMEKDTVESSESDKLCKNVHSSIDHSETMENNTELICSDASSRWFVMTIENDFTELQFYKRGFFVKYESIIKAINVARFSKKTVRLSSQKCTDRNSNPQFGIYAIPTVNEYCVFVGPYDKTEKLGIETVKSFLGNSKNKRTRGIWINTNKIDNLKVIDNPLSFMPSNDIPADEVVTLECYPDKNLRENKKIKILEHSENVENLKDSPTKSVNEGQSGKTIKPIKIRKSDGFYHLAPNSLLKSIQEKVVGKNKACQQSLVENKSLLNSGPKSSTSGNESPIVFNNPRVFDVSPLIKKPVAEIAPQVKEATVTTSSVLESVQQKEPAINKKRSEGGMFILKPEEINKRSLENEIFSETKLNSTSSKTEKSDTITDEDMNVDIENFLATTVVCTQPNSDVYIISDDEDDCNTSNTPIEQNWKEVWIECVNIYNIGWIPGRKDSSGKISFGFPGFSFTPFYREDVAFAKINQVFSRKVYIPEHIVLKWEVSESEEDFKNKEMLKLTQLRPDFVMTKKGLCHKHDMVTLNTNTVKTYSKVFRKSLANTQEDEINTPKKPKLTTDSEDTSDTLEKQSDIISSLNKTETKLQSFAELSNEVRQEMSEKLRSILSESSNS